MIPTFKTIIQTRDSKTHCTEDEMQVELLTRQHWISYTRSSLKLALLAAYFSSWRGGNKGEATMENWQACENLKETVAKRRPKGGGAWNTVIDSPEPLFLGSGRRGGA